MSAARFLLCVNGDQGLPTGHIEGVDFMGDDGVRLELRAGIWPPSDCPRFTHGDGWVRISRRKFPVLGYKSWVGNWCWDAVAMRGDVGADLLNYLKSLGWQCEGAEIHYGDMWDRGEKFRPSDAVVLTAAELAARKAETVSRICRMLKLPKGASLHTLRHSHGSQLIAQGVPIPEVSARLGHANPHVTMEVYAHEIPGKGEAAKKWDAAQEPERKERRQ